MVIGAQEIAVVRALGGLGDVLCAIPALSALRRANPSSRITYIGLPQVAGVVARFPTLVDRFVAFPGFPGIVEHPFKMARLTDFLATLRADPSFDLAIQMHGSGSVSNTFVAMLGARKIAGFHLPGLWCPDPATFMPYPADRPEPLRWLALTERLGMASDDASLAFPVEAGDRAAAADFGLAPRRFAVLHPGASDPRRRWPPQRFAAVGDFLAARGLAVAVTGTRDEIALTGAVVAAMDAPALDLGGRTTLGTVAAVIADAALVVTNDTGTSHLAAATGTESVVIFLASDRDRWAPVNTVRHRAVGSGLPDVPFGRVPTASRLEVPTVDAVLAAIDRPLEAAA